jgi:hypothetical protein
VVLGYSLEKGAGATVSSFIPEIERYLGDGGILYVDGIYLMEDEHGEREWRAIENIASGLKQLALDYPIAVLGNHQATVDDTAIPGMQNVAYAKGLSRFCDGMTSISQTEEERKAGYAWGHLIANRDGDIDSWPINMNFDPIDFSQKPIKSTEEFIYDDDVYEIGG